MDFRQFRREYQSSPLIFSRNIVTDRVHRQAERNQLSRWTKSGALIRLKRGVYLLNAQDRKVTPDVGTIANQLYEPSYISLEYALGLYGLIPEAARTITSVTTRKTQTLTNPLGTFVYQHVKPPAFRGFERTDAAAGTGFLIAGPEKALADWLYLHSARFGRDVADTLTGSFRFQHLDTLDPSRLRAWARLFDSAKLRRMAEAVCDLITGEHDD